MIYLHFQKLSFMHFCTPYKDRHRRGAVIKGISRYSLSGSDHTVYFVRKGYR